MKRWFFILMLLCGCEEFDTPADLDRPQLAAMQAEPPLVPIGASAELRALFLNADGEFQPDAVWEPVAPQSGGTPVGSVEIDSMGRVFAVPPPGLTTPTPAAFQVSAEVSGQRIIGIKALLFAAPEMESNPVIDTVTIDEVPVAMEPVVLPARGSNVALSATLLPDPGTSATYAWYTTVGDIERFLDQAPVLEITEETASGPGMIYVVGRNGRGGIAWRGIPVSVP